MNQLHQDCESGGKLPAVNPSKMQIIIEASRKWSVWGVIPFKMKIMPSPARWNSTKHRAVQRAAWKIRHSPF